MCNMRPKPSTVAQSREARETELSDKILKLGDDNEEGVKWRPDGRPVVLNGCC
jgi:hypothetical protein